VLGVLDEVAQLNVCLLRNDLVAEDGGVLEFLLVLAKQAQV